MESTPNVLFINHSVRDGGPGQSLFYILKYLDRSKLTPYVLIPKDDVFSERLKAEGLYENIIIDGRFPENLKKPRFSRHRSAIFTLLSIIINIFAVLSLIITSPYLIRRNKIKLIYCNGTQAKIVGALIGLINCRPVIWHVRNIQQTVFLGFVINFLALMPMVKKIICVSGPTATQFRYGKKKLMVIHNGIDVQDYNPRTTKGEVREKFSLGEESIIVGSTGRIVPRKGYDLFIKSAKVVVSELGSAAENVKFVIVGDTPYFFQDDHLSYLKTLVSEYGLRENFIFMGFKEDVRPCLKDFDIFVIPSSYPDPFPRSVIEAMSFSLPIIGFYAGGIVESVEDTVTGVLNELGNVDQMGMAIVRLISKPKLRKSMGKAGRKRVESKFSAFDRTMDIQKNILGVTQNA